ncbi:hypothetical protein BYT27DRAFT_7210160 [Phlegmacium glaucopus]|nr:hypothetical protein BYT27DRAFT_7210160 [Phlegmacium glaucopus]
MEYGLLETTPTELDQSNMGVGQEANPDWVVQALPSGTGPVLSISSKTCNIHIYHDPDTKSGAYHSSVIIEIFAVHHQLVAKTDKFYGFPAGALSLCAAAQECALKLWCSSDRPNKDTKTSFVCIPWPTHAATHFQTIKKLSESKWHVIVKAAGFVMDSHDEDFDPTGENNSELGDPDGVVIWRMRLQRPTNLHTCYCCLYTCQ